MNYKKELDNQGRYLNIDANDINEAYKEALADFELQNANYDELVSVLGTPEEFIHNYLEIYRDKIWNEEKPYRKSNHRITESLFHPLVKRSEDGAKFLPQFDPFMTFILILPGIYGLVIIGGYFSRIGSYSIMIP